MKNISVLLLVLISANTVAQASVEKQFVKNHGSSQHKSQTFKNWKSDSQTPVTTSAPFDLDSASAQYTSCVPPEINYNAAKTIIHTHQVSVSGNAKIEMKAEVSNCLLGALGLSGTAVQVDGTYLVQKSESLLVGPTVTKHPRCYKMSTRFTAKTMTKSMTINQAVWRGICISALHVPVEVFQDLESAVGNGTKVCCTEAITTSDKILDCPECPKE